jgi:hypothetical protein
MTAEERFERIEHVTAGLVEERRKDREDFRQLWRDTQRQISDVGSHLNDLTIKIADVDDRLGARIAEVDDRLGARIEALAEESRAADRRLGARVESMVSAIGEFIRVQREKG